MAAGIDGQAREGPELLPPQGIDEGDAVDRVAEELHPVGAFLFVGGEDLDAIAPDPESAPVKIDVVAFVLDLHQALQDVVAGDLHPALEQEEHPGVGLRGTEPVDARDARHDDHVAALQERMRRRMAQLVDLVVDGRILFDVRVRAGNVGFRLVVVVIADEILDGVVGEERAELLVELGGERLVVGDDERGAAGGLDDLGNGEGLAGSRHPQENLVGATGRQAGRQCVDGPGLVALGREIGHHSECIHRSSLPSPPFRIHRDLFATANRLRTGETEGLSGALRNSR